MFLIGRAFYELGESEKALPYIEEAVRWRMFDQTVQNIRARNVDRTADELQTLIDEACAAVRSEQHPSNR